MTDDSDELGWGDYPPAVQGRLVAACSSLRDGDYGPWTLLSEEDGQWASSAAGSPDESAVLVVGAVPDSYMIETIISSIFDRNREREQPLHVLCIGVPLANAEGRCTSVAFLALPAAGPGSPPALTVGELRDLLPEDDTYGDCPGDLAWKASQIPLRDAIAWLSSKASTLIHAHVGVVDCGDCMEYFGRELRKSTFGFENYDDWPSEKKQAPHECRVCSLRGGSHALNEIWRQVIGYIIGAL